MTQQEKILKLEDLKKQIEDMEREVRYLVEEIDKSKLDFDTWVRLFPKNDYEWIISRDEAPVLRSFVDDWIERYQTIGLDSILDIIEDMEVDDPDSEDLFNLKQELMTLNFGSMVCDW